MEEKDTNKTKWLHVRLSEDEYNKLQKQFKDTTCRKMSEYIRKKLFDKHLVLYYRNRSLDDLMAEVIPLRKSLFAISNNFNQAVRKLNSMRPFERAESWLQAYEQMSKTVENNVAEIKTYIQNFAEKWLQSSKQDHL